MFCTGNAPAGRVCRHQETDALHSLILEGWIVIMSLPSELPLELMGIIFFQPLNHPAACFPLVMYIDLPKESF